MAYTEKVNFSVTGTYGCGPEDEDDVYTIKEFLDLVKCGGFVDYDGYGHPVKNKLADRTIMIQPSNVKKKLPADATHIIWYNR